ncbi:LysM peptidoglycan-binding domain-containing protein [Metabacillus sp. Hm71]|uniref:LysM peptidoglycan-binding domain-containing protein n=1 Tax=Metabacillus sp. Hm71 TaxID=3450743 RepID=UPI003F431D34
MLYFIKANDTLHDISVRFRSSIQAILRANIICDPNRIFPGTPLMIPQTGINLPQAGGNPYYVIQPGDTLECLAFRFHSPVETLKEINHLNYSAPLLPGTELLVGVQKYNSKELYDRWTAAGDTDLKCSASSNHEVFFRGSYEWEAIGDPGIPYLAELLKHPCDGVKLGAVLSLGRIASSNAQQLLGAFIKQSNDPLIIEVAQTALQRIQVVQQTKNKRFHLTMHDWLILKDPISSSIQTNIPKGTVVIGIRWNIPSPFQEEGPKGGLQMFDYIQIVNTGQTGFMPRVGYNSIWLI